MRKITITTEMINEISELEYESQTKIIMSYIEFFLRGDMGLELSELEQFILNKWVDDELARNNYTLKQEE